MFLKKFLSPLIIIIMLIALTGCTLNLTATPKNIGGVFKSYDFGEKWQAMNLVKSDKKKITLDNVNVNKIILDPLDHKNVYLTTGENGLWYSDNAAGTWQQIFPQGNVYDLALDPKNSGLVYISLGKKLYKTLNLGADWQPIYFETREKVLITALASDPINNLLIYLGTSNGEIYKTEDGGESWQLITQTEEHSPIQKILINPKDNKVIYLATAGAGIYKSSDQGKKWQNLKDNYYYQDKDKKSIRYNGAEAYRSLTFDLTQNDALVYASNYGLLKSNDGGKTWQEIKLLTPPNSVIIKSLAVNPQDNQQIYYGTGTALYRTFDAGKTWLTSSSPSPRSVNYLLVDPQTPNVVYVGMASIQR